MFPLDETNVTALHSFAFFFHFREHLGLSENDTEVDLMDLTSDSFFKEVWFSQAENNTSIFEKVPIFSLKVSFTCLKNTSFLCN